MKVVVENEPKSKPKPILPLEDVEEDDIPKDRTRSYTLRSNPADATSPTFKLTTYVFQGTESVRQALKWRKTLQQVLSGLNLAGDNEESVDIIRTLLASSALTTFNVQLRSAASTQQGVDATAAGRRVPEVAGDPDRTAANRLAAVQAVMAQPLTDHCNRNVIKVALDSLIEMTCPPKALQKVKRYIRRDLRKPAHLKIREFNVRLHHILTEEIPNLPPFALRQGIEDDEVKDIICHAIPKSWVREMDRQGKDPDHMTTAAIITFLEGVEEAEDFEPDKKGKDNNKNSKGKGQKSSNKSNNSNNNSKGGCLIHGPNAKHTTNECRDAAKRLKTDNNNKGDGKKSYGNKSWSRKSEEAKKETLSYLKKETMKEVNSFAKTAVKHAVKKAMKEVNTFNRKRSNNDSSDDEGEMHSMEKQMFNMDINKRNPKSKSRQVRMNSDDDISV